MLIPSSITLESIVVAAPPATAEAGGSFLFQILHSPAFWGTVAGALFTLLGVFVTNLFNVWQLSRQFNHEQKQKAKDREMSLRKELFLDATEAIAEGVMAIGRFTNLELPHDQVSGGFFQKTPALMKLHIVASLETIKVVEPLVYGINQQHLELHPKRSKVVEVTSKIKMIDDQVAYFLKNQEQTIQLMKNYNLNATKDAQHWAALQHDAEFASNQIALARQERQRLESQQKVLLLDLTMGAVVAVSNIQKSVFSALSALRNELDLPYDEKAYLEFMEELAKHSKQNAEDFLRTAMPAD